MTQTAEILALPLETAGQHQPVSLSGVVTAAEPDWEGKFFLQDASGGVFVMGDGRQPRAGDVVTLEGMTHRGAFAPIVAQAQWTIVRSGPQPPAKTTTVERLMSGAEDGQRVEFTGRVRSAYFVPSRKLAVDVSFGASRVHVFPKLPANVNPESLVAARVRIRGTVAASFNAALHQLTSINVYVPEAEDFVVEEPEQRPPFEQPILQLGEIARYHPEVNRGDRIHVRGTVTFVRPGLDLFIQDATGGLHLECAQPVRLAPGDVIEAVGFLSIASYRPVLQDARLRREDGSTAPIPPLAVSYDELRAGLHGSELIEMRGRLVGRTVRPVRRELAAFNGVRTTCTIQTSNLTFTTECEHDPNDVELAAIPLGSLVAVTGVSSIETGYDGQLNTLTLLQRTARDMRVLETPGWWTTPRLLLGAAILFVGAIAAFVWSLTVSRKNAMLGFLVADREKAQRELQQAHDLLEKRVEERTEQLKVEMTARKAAEVEFRATLIERTRLARELHDTLEQALAGIALQLDTTARLLARSPEEAREHLELARGFMRQSQIELRRSIWDLRSRELERFDVAAALQHTAQQIAQGTPLRVDFETSGTPRPLPEVIEENLLRIGQEALTNVVKHSGATLVTLHLEFSEDTVSLEVKDNGTGLVADKVAGLGEKHFGLIGMSERSKRFGGRLDVSSSPGEGTTVRVVLPAGSAHPNGTVPVA